MSGWHIKGRTARTTNADGRSRPIQASILGHVVVVIREAVPTTSQVMVVINSTNLLILIWERALNIGNLVVMIEDSLIKVEGVLIKVGDILIEEGRAPGEAADDRGARSWSGRWLLPLRAPFRAPSSSPDSAEQTTARSDDF